MNNFLCISYNYLTCASSSVAIKPGITYANNRTKSVQTDGVNVTERRQTLVDILMIKNIVIQKNTYKITLRINI